MPPEFASLIDHPLLLIGVLFVGALVGMVVETFTAKRRRQAWKARNGWRWAKDRRGATLREPRADAAPPKLVDAADQLRIVMAASFAVQPLLNRSEARLFGELDRLVQARNSAWQVMAQVSCGEILQSKDKAAYLSINSKRVDLLLVDGDCRPVAAIEYQGEGHHQGSAAARDAVKKEALRRAGIGYHEVIAGVTTRAELKRLVERLVSNK